MSEVLEAVPPMVFYGKTLRFNEKAHRYYLDDIPIPSVTTILGRLHKPLLIQWAADKAIETVRALSSTDEDGLLRIDPAALERCRKAHATIRDEAADIGKFVHAYAEARLKGERPQAPMIQLEKNAAQAFEDWLKSQKVEPIALERRIVSEVNWYAGTCDFYGTINGRLCVLDFKTGKAVYDEYWMQTEAYALALEEETGQTVQDKHIIRLDKATGDFEAVCRPCTQQHRTAWIYLAHLDRALRTFKDVA